MNLTLPKGNPPSGQIIGTQFNGHAIAHQDFHPVFPNFTANGCQNGWLGFWCSINATAEHGIGQGFDDDCFNFDDIIFLFLDAHSFIFAIISLCPGCFLAMKLCTGNGTGTGTIIDEG